MKMYSKSVMPDSPILFDQLRGLLEKLREAQARTDERAKTTHEHFNVFTTLLKPDDEVRLHTRFLYCLLDPEGCHDCGSLFLGLFFETLAELPGADHKGNTDPFEFPHANATWNVGKEQRRGDFGQIDILLAQNQPSYGIAIENKINHHEREDQLSDYASYLEKQHGTGKGMVIFLTLDGKQSESHKGTIPYRRISYEKHILAWLDKCLEKTWHIIPINQVILQYRKVVRDLTGKTIESEYMKPPIDFIKQNPDIIRFWKQISDGVDEVRKSYVDALIVGIEENLNRNGFTPVRLQEGRFGAGLNRMALLPPINSDLRNAPFRIWIEHDPDPGFEFLILGIVTQSHHNGNCRSESDKVQIVDLPQDLFACIKNRLEEKFKGNDCFEFGRCGNEWPAGWLILARLDDEHLALSLGENLEKTASKIFDEMATYLNHLAEVYSEIIHSTPHQL